MARQTDAASTSYIKACLICSTLHKCLHQAGCSSQTTIWLFTTLVATCAVKSHVSANHVSGVQSLAVSFQADTLHTSSACCLTLDTLPSVYDCIACGAELDMHDVMTGSLRRSCLVCRQSCHRICLYSAVWRSSTGTLLFCFRKLSCDTLSAVRHQTSHAWAAAIMCYV